MFSLVLTALVIITSLNSLIRGRGLGNDGNKAALYKPGVYEKYNRISGLILVLVGLVWIVYDVLQIMGKEPGTILFVGPAVAAIVLHVIAYFVVLRPNRLPEDLSNYEL